MTEAEANARVAAIATQVAILHNALSRIVNALSLFENVTDQIIGQELLAAARAALAASEPECAELLTLAREVATIHVQDSDELGTLARALLALLNHIEGNAS